MYLTVEVDADPGAQLFEQPIPRGVADWAEIREHALLGLGELVRPELARLLDHVSVGGSIRIGVKVGCLLVADLGELESEENAMAPALGRGLAHARKKATGCVVLGVLAVEKICIDLRPGGELLVLFQLAHHGRELVRREQGDLALVPRLESLRAFERVGQRLLDRRVGRRFEKVGQIPANVFSAGGLRCLCNGTVRITASSVRLCFPYPRQTACSLLSCRPTSPDR